MFKFKKYFVRILSLLPFIVLIFLPISVHASSTLVINEFQVSGTVANDEFVSIGNFGNKDEDLRGYSIARKIKSSTTFNTLFKFEESYILKANSTVKINHSAYTGEKGLTYTSSTYNMTPDNTLVLFSPTKSIIDLVGYGSATLSDGEPVPTPEAKQIYSRIEGMDTDNNFRDFILKANQIAFDSNLYNIQISEIYPSPESGSEEWFELYNPTNFTVALKGLKVCDGTGSVRCFYLGGQSINPFSFLAFTKSETKITLNNNGDWLELYDPNENLIFDTENFGEAEVATSFSLFGSTWDWTKVATRNGQNIFESVVEEEPVKTAKPKIKKVSTKKVSSSKKTSADAETESEPSAQSEVKGAAEEAVVTVEPNKKLDRKTLGYLIIALAILIFCGYILWENKEKVCEIYSKVTRRNN